MKKTESKILVVGATGLLGTEICRQLVASKKNVAALVRTTSDVERVAALRQMGVQLVQADLRNKKSVQLALQGVTTVISNATAVRSAQSGDSIQSVDNEGQVNLVKEAEAAGINQFIFISFPAMHEEFPLQNAKRNVEQMLRASKMNFTILQPTFFTEVWLSPALGFDFANARATVYGEGKAKVSWISIEDLAAWTVAAVEREYFENKTIQLGGPQALGPLEVVALFEKASGKKFEVTHIPVNVLRQQRDAAPDDLNKTFASLMLNYAPGSEVDMKDLLSAMPMKLRSVSNYARAKMQSLQ